MSTDTTTTNPGVTTTAAGRVAGGGLDMDVVRRTQIGVRCVLALAVAASVAANVLHAQPSLVGRVIAGWPSVALLLALELIWRVPVASRGMSVARIAATTLVAGIAGWASYWHMVDVARAYGETTTSAHLVPLSVDGLVAVATVCLVEIGHRLRGAGALDDNESSDVVPTEDTVSGAPPESTPAAAETAAPAPAPGSARDVQPPSPRLERPGARGRKVSTGDLVARLRARHPEWTQAQVAARLGVTDRTVRRHWLSDPDTASKADAVPAADPTDGTAPDPHTDPTTVPTSDLTSDLMTAPGAGAPRGLEVAA